MMVFLMASLSFVDGIPSTRYFITKRRPEELSAPGVAIWMVATAQGEDEEQAKHALEEKLGGHPVTSRLCRDWLQRNDQSKWDLVRKVMRRASEKLLKKLSRVNGTTPPDSSPEA